MSIISLMFQSYPLPQITWKTSSTEPLRGGTSLLFENHPLLRGEEEGERLNAAECFQSVNFEMIRFQFRQKSGSDTGALYLCSRQIMRFIWVESPPHLSVIWTELCWSWDFFLIELDWLWSTNVLKVPVFFIFNYQICPKTKLPRKYSLLRMMVRILSLVYKVGL